MTEMSGADMVVQALVDLGVDTVFGYPGGAVLPIYDALFKQNHVRHILVRHEQAAVHAAEGFARSTGKAGVVLILFMLVMFPIWSPPLAVRVTGERGVRMLNRVYDALMDHQIQVMGGVAAVLGLVLAYRGYQGLWG